MSTSCGMELIIYSVGGLIEAIKDLNLAYQEKETITADGKIYNVDVVIEDKEVGSIGFQKQKDGSYKVIADSLSLSSIQLKKQRELINKIKRRYAYNMVIQELKKRGYQVVKEDKLEEGTIKLTARRWTT